MTQAPRTPLEWCAQLEQRVNTLESSNAELRAEVEAAKTALNTLATSPALKSVLAMLKIDVTALFRPAPPGTPP